MYLPGEPGSEDGVESGGLLDGLDVQGSSMHQDHDQRSPGHACNLHGFNLLHTRKAQAPPVIPLSLSVHSLHLVIGLHLAQSLSSLSIFRDTGKHQIIHFKPRRQVCRHAKLAPCLRHPLIKNEGLKTSSPHVLTHEAFYWMQILIAARL